MPRAATAGRLAGAECRQRHGSARGQAVAATFDRVRVRHVVERVRFGKRGGWSPVGLIAAVLVVVDTRFPALARNISPASAALLTAVWRCGG